MSTVNIIISASYEKKAMKAICVIMEKVMRIISVTKVKKKHARRKLHPVQ